MFSFVRNLNSDAPVQWQIGPKKLIPELIARQSNRRIYITIMDRINIEKAKISDSNVYRYPINLVQHKNANSL